jgi:hypothetical protein
VNQRFDFRGLLEPRGRSAIVRHFFQGEVAEWSKAHAWNACRRATVSRVRIPPSPPADGQNQAVAGDSRLCPTKCPSRQTALLKVESLLIRSREEIAELRPCPYRQAMQPQLISSKDAKHAARPGCQQTVMAVDPCLQLSHALGELVLPVCHAPPTRPSPHHTASTTAAHNAATPSLPLH